jgi:hypothetical protein
MLIKFFSETYIKAWGMSSSGMLHLMALGRTEITEEHSTSIITVTKIGELEKTLAVTSNRSTLVFLRNVRRLLAIVIVVPSSPILVTLMTEPLLSSEKSGLTSATWHNIALDDIVHERKYLKLNFKN